MKSRSDIVSGLQHLRMAKDHFQSFILDNKNSRGSKQFGVFVKRIDWMFFDLITNPSLPQKVVDGVLHEVNSDVWAVPAITEKIALLKPEQRELLEDVIDKVISGDMLLVNDKIA